MRICDFKEDCMLIFLLVLVVILAMVGFTFAVYKNRSIIAGLNTFLALVSGLWFGVCLGPIIKAENDADYMVQKRNNLTRQFYIYYDSNSPFPLDFLKDIKRFNKNQIDICEKSKSFWHEIWYDGEVCRVLQIHLPETVEIVSDSL